MSFQKLHQQCVYDLERKEKLQSRTDDLVAMLQDANQKYMDLLNAQRLLSTISEENTVRTLEYITGIINKVLFEIFQGSSRKVYLEKTLHNNRYAHINVQLETADGTKRDLDLQTGSGVKEVISFLFTVCIISVRGGRKLLIMDELLSGLHRDAKKVIGELIELFSAEGFQFVFVEYGLDTVGKIYNIENRLGVAKAVEVEGDYTGDRYTS